MTGFASDYPRTPEGWIKFPSDIEERRAIFGSEVMKHPAKANLFMLEEIINSFTEQGDLILDPMAGTGSILAATMMERRVVCIDVEEGYHRLQMAALERISQASGEVQQRTTLLHGDCLAFLPLPVDHIIFSPPYGTALRRTSAPKTAQDKALAGTYQDEAFADYSASLKNVGNMNDFFYNMAMKKVYSACFDCLSSGGTMTVILKDHMKAGKRVKLSDWMMRCCIRSGFELLEWNKRFSPGTGYTKLWKKKGFEVVQDEDIITMQRP